MRIGLLPNYIMPGMGIVVMLSKIFFDS